MNETTMNLLQQKRSDVMPVSAPVAAGVYLVAERHGVMWLALDVALQALVRCGYSEVARLLPAAADVAARGAGRVVLVLSPNGSWSLGVMLPKATGPSS